MKTWRYYNHAMVPKVSPNEQPNMNPLEDGSIWEDKNKPLLVRWTTDFDCGFETNWWYCIKDTPFDISKLNSKKRYEINKGKKNFNVREINPFDFVDEIYEVTVAAYSSWPEKYRPVIDELSFKNNEILLWKDKRIIAAFTVDCDSFAGYTYLTEYSNYTDFNMLRVKPEYEKLAINAALVNGVVEYYNDKLCENYFILDGARSISHETAFQEYLEKYFEFRKAYCRLHISYKRQVKFIICCLYPFRKILLELDGIGLIHKVNALLKMEEIVRVDDERFSLNNHTFI